MASKKLTVALLGATGETGLRTLEQLLHRGHCVRALVRSPHKINTKHDNLSVLKTDMYSDESVKAELEGCNAVISCLGTRANNKEPPLYLNTMQVIVKAMREKEIKRIVTMTSWGTYSDPRSPFFVEYFMRKIIASILSSMREMELFLAGECKDLDFTVVRPPGLTQGSLTGKTARVEEEAACVPQGWCATSMSMPRADVAKFMIECAEDSCYLKKAVAIL
ncbi:flavin reductase (NADPH)-like isoform X1 [Watersipora subatra]|uniref:flavin reductase (NADPH)-like isoform X1 n=1 Tax=Watersipora subatra TaxID=2589382 RepID=UPI00355AD808